MGDNNTITLLLKDETEDGRFSKVDVETSSLNTATKTKTDVAVSNKSASKNIASQVGTNVGMDAANTVTGGMAGQITGIASIATNPVAIAMFALGMAKRAYNHFEDMNRRLNEMDDIRLRAGGETRGEVNQLNIRRNIFGGRITSGSYFRR